LTVVLLQKFAEAAARLIPQWEIIDYAHDAKVDAPSGTARELAFRLSQVRSPDLTVPLAQTVGPRFCNQRRSDLWNARSEADNSSRLREQRAAVHRRSAARHSEGLHTRRRPSRSGCCTRSLMHADVKWDCI
jgi:hypothetical protein